MKRVTKTLIKIVLKPKMTFSIGLFWATDSPKPKDNPVLSQRGGKHLNEKWWMNYFIIKIAAKQFSANSVISEWTKWFISKLFTR